MPSTKNLRGSAPFPDFPPAPGTMSPHDDEVLDQVAHEHGCPYGMHWSEWVVKGKPVDRGVK